MMELSIALAIEGIVVFAPICATGLRDPNKLGKPREAIAGQPANFQTDKDFLTGARQELEDCGLAADLYEGNEIANENTGD